MSRTDLFHTGRDGDGSVAADLVEAELAAHPADRFLAAHRAALRTTSVVLGLRPPRHTGRRNAWQLVAQVAPELAEWAGFFLAVQARKEVVEAGVRAGVSEREADDLLRDAQRFCAVVEQWCARQRAHGEERSGSPRPPGEERSGSPRPPSEERSGSPRPPGEERSGSPRPPSEERSDETRWVS